MDFEMPIFNEGMNITVRKGVRWDIVKCPMPVSLESVDKRTKVEGTLLASYATEFDSIPDNLLVLEHDPLCRNKVGLLKVMESVYPDFNCEDVVTIVFFVPESSEYA